MAIKELSEIPVDTKKPTTRSLVRADIQEALDKGIKLFEFEGEYNFSTLAGNVREVLKEMKRTEVAKIQKDFKVKNYTDDERTIRGFWVRYKSNYEYKNYYIKVITKQDKKLKRTRVFCKIEGYEEFREKVLSDCMANLEEARREYVLKDGKWFVKKGGKE